MINLGLTQAKQIQNFLFFNSNIYFFEEIHRCIVGNTYKSLQVNFIYIIVTIYNTVILVRSVIKFFTEIFTLSRRFKSFQIIQKKLKSKNFIARRAKIIVLNTGWPKCTDFFQIVRIVRIFILHVSLSICLYILSVSLFIYISMCLSVSLTIYLSIYLSVCLSIYLSLYQI